MKHHSALLSLACITLLGQDVQGQACSVTSTTTPPAYPADGGFTTSGLISMAAATEVVTLQYTPNTPPDGFDDQVDCPYDQSGLLAWEDAATWTSGVVPGDGEDVVLPEDTRVLLGGCSVSADTVHGKITIPASSELIFADEDIFFNTTGMQVEGKLTLGSESCRLHSDIVITLHGDRPDSLPAPAWYKGIAAVGTGTLDIHGSIFHPTWTRLAATAAAGDTQIYLQHRVNWRAGQRLVLTGTEIKDSRDWHRNEVRKIADVQVNGEFSRITLTEALAYTHYGGPEYQGEVGLLSRNIVIQGDETSEPTDTDNDVCEHDKFGTYPCEHKWLTGYGGHTIAMGPNATTRFEGVELYRMGQTNVLARYPWHVHVIGEGGFRSYLKHSSMHHTFYRCATIHGTHNTLVQDNVAYDAIGHCFYSGEDGVEENNTVAFNLGSHVHFMEYPRTAYAQKMSAISSYENLTQPADTTASPFYITNAYNSYIGNAASGGYAGFAVVRLPKPIMVFRDAQTRSGRDVPHSLPFLAFEGNSCHSVGSSWWVFQSCIYVGGQLWHPSADSSALSYNPGRIVSGRDTKCTTADGSLVKCPLVMNNTKIFLSNIGINNWGARGSIDAFEAHDTMRAAAIIGSHYVHNMLTECRTSSGFVPEKPSSHYYEKLWHLGKHVGFEWYDTLQAHLIDGITFRNCGNAKKNYPVWRFLTHSDRYVPGLMQSSRRVKYENVDREALVMPSSQSLLSVSGALANWVDDDGTAFGGVEDGSSGPKLIGAARDGVEWWRLDDNCTQEGMWYNCDRLAPASGQRRGVGSFTAVVDPEVQAQFAANNICMNVGSTPCPRIGSAMHLGQAGDPAEVGLPIRGNAVVTGPTNGLGWLLLFDAGSPVSAKFSKPQIDEDDTVIIVMPYPAGTTFRVTYEAVSWCKPKYNTCEHVFTKATSLREMLDGVGDQYYFSASRGLFFVRFTPQKRDALDFSQAPGYGNLGLSYFEHDNMTRIPGTVSGGGIVIEASGCTLNATNENFCEKSEYDDTDICSEFGYPAGSTQIAYDTCVPSSAVVLPTFNPTSAPTTLAPTQTPTQTPTTLAPTQTPTQTPTTLALTQTPTQTPTTLAPTQTLTQTPTTLAPTQTPTQMPTTLAPTQTPTQTPTTLAPTQTPTQTPTTLAPTSADSEACTVSTMEGRYIGPTSKTVLVTVWEVDSVTACQDECRKHEACQAYNYKGEKRRCNLLRKDTHELLYKDAWTSGFFDCPGDEPVTSFCRHHDTTATGTLLRSFSTRWNYRYCQRQCLNDAACVHYVLQEGSCTLLSAFASSSPLSGATSGPRECKPL